MRAFGPLGRAALAQWPRRWAEILANPSFLDLPARRAGGGQRHIWRNVVSSAPGRIERAQADRGEDRLARVPEAAQHAENSFRMSGLVRRPQLPRAPRLSLM